MATTNAGATLIATLVESHGSFYVGAGDSSTAFSASQTDLQGTNVRKAATVVRSGSTLTYSASFGTSEANFAWSELGSFDAASGPTMITRKVVSLPTKTSSETWDINLEVVYAAA